MSATTLQHDRIEECHAGDACPACGDEVVNVQGILACAGCGRNSA